MRKFLTKTALFFLFLATCITLVGSCTLFFIAPQYINGYNASIIDKIEHLKNSPSPKIILVGNSNLAFGINSELIEAEFDMPVVNLGLHGSLGNAFHESMAHDYINKGDIVIVCHSTYKDYGNLIDCELAWITLENHFNLYHFVNHRDYVKLARAFLSYIYKATHLFISIQGNQKTVSSYSRQSFNQYGDNVFPRKYDSELTKKLTPNKPEINDCCINRLNRLNDYCKSKGANLLIGGVPILCHNKNEDVIFYKDFEKQLQNQLKCEIISDFTDYLYDETLFFDTNLHLTNEGAEIRTKQLINDLKLYFDNNHKNTISPIQ